jgi:hypothetical protein
VALEVELDLKRLPVDLGHRLEGVDRPTQIDYAEAAREELDYILFEYLGSGKTKADFLKEYGCLADLAFSQLQAFVSKYG